MLKSKKPLILLSLFVAVILCFSIVIDATAATGNQGYAIYRDGAIIFNVDWHAGLMDKPDTSYWLPVVHIGGLGVGVTYALWGDFMDGNTFMGVYKPNSYISSARRDLVVAMGRVLTTEDLGYTVLSQIDYFVYGGGWVYPEDLYTIRCDGVVEYCYEWYGYRIYGDDSLWDITVDGFDTLNHHSGTNVTPRKQAQYSMTLVQTMIP